MFLCALQLELLGKIKNYLVSTHQQKPGLSITQEQDKQNKKNPAYRFADIHKTKH